MLRAFSCGLISGSVDGKKARVFGGGAGVCSVSELIADSVVDPLLVSDPCMELRLSLTSVRASDPEPLSAPRKASLAPASAKDGKRSFFTRPCPVDAMILNESLVGTDHDCFNFTCRRQILLHSYFSV